MKKLEVKKYKDAVVSRFHNRRVQVIHNEENERVEIIIQSCIKGLRNNPNPITKRGDYIEIPMSMPYESAAAIWHGLNSLFNFQIEEQ